MRNTLFAILLFVSGLIHAQSGINRFEWKAKPELHTIPSNFKEAAAVYVFDDRIIEYAFEKDDLFLFRTLHRIIHINKIGRASCRERV